ncbi:hypothetical protein DVW42_15935, partial [Enterococcus faecium]
FVNSLTSLSIRFWLAVKDMGLSEELEVLEQEKTLFYRQNFSQHKLERSEDEIELYLQCAVNGNSGGLCRG